MFFSLGKKMPVLCLSTEARNEIHLNFTSHLGVTKYAGKLEYLLVDYALELFFPIYMDPDRTELFIES